MAKKRTLVPYYGKDNQFLEQAATRSAASGDTDTAKAMMDKSKALLKKKKESR